MPNRSFTEVIRQELARLPIESLAAGRAELAAMVRTAGSLTLRGGDPPQPVLTITTASGAVARRAHALIVHVYGIRPELQVRAPGGVHHRPRYAVAVTTGVRRIGRDLGVLDAGGRPRGGRPRRPRSEGRAAFVRGALLGAGSVSAPARAPHLELVVGDHDLAAVLAEVIADLIDGEVSVTGEERPRVVLKSGERIGALLAAVGATGSYLEVEEQRLRRQLRGEANRLANADRANLTRTIDASAEQVATVERAIMTVGWSALDDGLRDVALARLANPEASLAELGALLDPPIGKSAVHRRLRRLEGLAAGSEDPAERGPQDA
ncbi:MAG: DNA-binding protein WhiA [Nitriliruptoraceae bacterium]